MDYKHTLQHYAEQYGRSLRTIKRYAQKKAPLDDPQRMGYFMAVQKDTGRVGRRNPVADAEAAPEHILSLRSASDALGEAVKDLLDIIRLCDAPEPVREVASSQVNLLSDFCGQFHGGFERAGVDLDRDVFQWG